MRGEMCRALELRPHRDRASPMPGSLGCQLHHIIEGEQREQTVQCRVFRPPSGPPFDTAQLAQLVEGEVVDEPTGQLLTVNAEGALAVGKPGTSCDIGRLGQFDVVSDDQCTVSRDDKVGLQNVGAGLQRELVRRHGVLKAAARGATMTNDQWAGSALWGALCPT